MHILYDSERSEFVTKSLENVIHLLNLQSYSGWEAANKALKHYMKFLDHEVLAEDVQALIDLVGPSLSYAQHIADEKYVHEIEYWANDLYRDGNIDVCEHMGCSMCWGPDSPEVIANQELRERAKRKKQRGKADIS